MPIKFTKLTLITLATIYFSSCASSVKDIKEDNGSSHIKEISFEELSIPKTKQEKISLRISPSAKVTYDNGDVKSFPLSYQVVFRPGDMIDGKAIGTLFNQKGEPLKDENGKPDINNSTDGESIIEKNGNFYLYNHFETYPGAIYITNLEKQPNGQLKPVKTMNADFSDVGGTMINCASSVTPWNTHLSSEEDYYFDGTKFDNKTQKYVSDHINLCKIDSANKITDTKKYFCHVTKQIREKYLSDPNSFTPYNYGYIVEVNEKGKVKNGLKHFVMGKGSPEMAFILPDRKTAYITDDGDYRGFYLFVADKADDLSAGTLYMAGWEQTSAENDGTANLKWIKLGHGTNSQVKNIIDRKPYFTDIFDVNDSETCNGEGFKMVKAGDPDPMCIRVKDGTNGSLINTNIFKSSEEVRMAAAFLETRKYGVYLGATAEFRKEEGVTYDPDRNAIYLAMSEINKSMEDNYKKNEPQNHVRLPLNACGTVYKVDLGNGKDVGGEKISSKYVGKTMSALVSGKPIKTGDQGSDENYCHPNYIANPDNINYIAKDILMIAEDTHGHPNANAWAYNIKNKTLTRIMTAPTGAEFSGVFTHLASGKRHYIFVVAQHPFNNDSYNTEGKQVDVDILKSATAEEKRSYIGYIHGLPALNK